MKTIRMPKALLEDWLNTLRSDEVKQGQLKLIDRLDGSMCCLGVLEYCAAGHKAEEVEDNSCPSMHWLDEHDVHFTGSTALIDPAAPTNEGMHSPCVLLDDGCWAGLTIINDGGFASAVLPDKKVYRVEPRSFAEIADLIEAHAETTDA